MRRNSPFSQPFEQSHTHDEKTLLGIAILTASGAAVASDFYNGRLTAMSGAGFVTGGHTDGVLLNPSLGADYGPKDDFGLVFNFGAMASDRDDLLDAIDDLVDFLDYIDDSNIEDLGEGDAEELKRLLSNTDNKTVFVGIGGNFLASIPNKHAAASLFARSRFAVSFTPVIDDDDYARIDDAVGGEFESDDLSSSINGRGALITEVGIALAKTLYPTEDTRLLVGVTPKQVSVETIVYNARVGDFDEDDLDADDYTVSGSLTTLDAGVTYISGKLRYGFVIRDLIGKDFETVDVDGDKLSIKPQSTAAIGYDGDWFTAEAAVDLNAVPHFALNGDMQLVRAGFEFNAWSWAQLRAGFQTDLKNAMEDTYSLGLGLSPFDVINLDIAVTTGSNNTYGGSLQLGLRF